MARPGRGTTKPAVGSVVVLPARCVPQTKRGQDTPKTIDESHSGDMETLWCGG